MFASGTIDRHLLDGITIFGLLLGMLGSFYLAYDVFRLPILKKLTWSLTCALPPAVIAMSVVGAFGFTSAQNQADVLKDMLVSGLYWGLFGAGTAYYTLRSQPYESRLQEIFSLTDTLRGLVAGAILAVVCGLGKYRLFAHFLWPHRVRCHQPSEDEQEYSISRVHKLPVL